jgi:hypothetical protein
MLFPGMIEDSLSFCHAERSEASRHLGAEMLRFACHIMVVGSISNCSALMIPRLRGSLALARVGDDTERGRQVDLVLLLLANDML